MKKHILIAALTNAGATTLYVLTIASFLFYGETFFGADERLDTVLAPVLMLLLLVISAAITGFAVFGKPVIWYLDGKKQDALRLLGMTLLLLAVVSIALIMLMLPRI